MDFLTHLFLPLTAVYVVRRDLFDSPWPLGLAAFGLLPDFDKFLRMPGLLHSLVTIVPLCLVILALERWLRGDLRYGPVVVALVGSHLLLDFLDGGPVPLLYPLVETGIGLQFPAQTVFGQGPLGLRFEGPLVALRTASVRPENFTYGFIQGGGVASMLLFAVVYAGDRLRGQRDGRETTPAATSTAEPASGRDGDASRSSRGGDAAFGPGRTDGPSTSRRTDDRPASNGGSRTPDGPSR